MVAQEVRHLVHPHTGQFLHRRPVDDTDDACLAQMTAATIPLGRLARSQEIADEIEFVASERASLFTGHGHLRRWRPDSALCPSPRSETVLPIEAGCGAHAPGVYRPPVPARGPSDAPGL
jgi:hypothetical protein